MKYTSIELFAGAGGLALGLEISGFEPILLIEWDKHASATLRANRPDWCVVEGDVEDVVGRGKSFYLQVDVPIDLLSGGFPCQAFSYAGKRLGLEDTRGTLFFSFATALQQLKPRMFLAENVKGLLTHDKGNTIRGMLDVFEESGYVVKHTVLNAWDFKSAQKRERLIIVGIRKDLKDSFEFPTPDPHRLVLRNVLRDVPTSPYSAYSAKKAAVLGLVPPGGCWKDLPEDIAKQYMGKSYYSGGGRTGVARRLSWDEPSLTILCSPSQMQTERCHPEETRPLTIRESARIQGFPDDWVFEGSISAQYKQIGNAVPVGLAEAVGRSIRSCLDQMEERNE